MTNQWSRWGRGSCEGYSLSIGDGGFTRFEGSVTRGVRDHDGNIKWTSAINGRCHCQHTTMAEAMARVEFELRIAGEAFVTSYTAHKENRHKNKFSQAVDAARNGPS